MLGQGVHPKVVQGRLGHSQVGITLNISSHALSGPGREAVERLGTTLEPGDGTSASPCSVDADGVLWSDEEERR